MPGLDPILEFGPALEVRLWRQKDEREFWLKMPLRAAISIGDPILDYQGIVFSPYLQYIKRYHFARSIWRFKVSAGPMFASRQYHDYFYEVQPDYANEQRPVYQSGSGYSGSRVTLSIARNSKEYFLGVFARYDSLSGAVFEDSPLVETNEYLVYGIAFAWIFSVSDERSPH
jgi:outer membrane scaffolding protein for murein synthesis (MipA/OmpV family)